MQKLTVQFSRILIVSTLLLFMAAPGFCKASFPWSMYLPPITTQCYSVSVTYCYHQSNCETAGGYWYDSICNIEPQPVCGPEFPELCLSETDCLNAGAYWYENFCNSDQSPNYLKTIRLAGDWVITVFTGGHNLKLFYKLNGNTTGENPDGSGDFTLTGFDEDLNVVTGSYESTLNLYTFRVDRGDQDYYYEFDFINNQDVTGCLYVSQHSNDSQSECFDMVGTRISN